MPFHADIEKWCDLKPNVDAVTIGDETLSFQQLIAQRNELNCRVVLTDTRQYLHQLNAKVVALVAENSLQFIGQFLSTTYGHNCCLLLSSTLKASQVKSTCDQIRPDVIISHSLFDEFEHSYDEISKADSSQFKAHLAGENDDDASTPFLIGLTSGTTSQPKAFIRNRQSWRVSLMQSRGVFEVEETTTTISPGPLAHGLSLYAMAETLSAGAHFISMKKFDALGVVELIAQHNAKRLVMVPTMLSGLCKVLETQNIQLDQITSIVTAGSKLDATLLRHIQNFMPNAKVFEYYGASELGFVTYAVRQLDDGYDVGHAFPGVELAILDKDGENLPLGDSGKVCVKSDYICDGYISKHDGAGFSIENGWASVGDIGYLDENERLVLAGREGDMIISGGNNIYPSSVENVLKGLAAVEDVVVLGLDDAHLGSKLVAIISGKQLCQADLTNHCQQELAVYAIPKLFYYVQDWPMTESGKISKKILMDWVSTNNDQLQRL
ncbi:MAG: AMP-binding protein [Lentilitoribacter sp.]